MIMNPRGHIRTALTSGAAARTLSVSAFVILLACLDGCTRNFYRTAADKEVDDILAEKDHEMPWKIRHWHVYPDPRARFADSTKPDRPPMPPDDPMADQLSPHPQQPGHAGVARVEGTGFLEMIKVWDVENREARKTLADAERERDKADPETRTSNTSRKGPVQELVDGPLVESQGFLLTMEQAVELGVVNSREYQSIREDLYLATLPVTLQRFSFVFQGAATEQAIRQWAGPGSSVGPENRWLASSNFGVSKLFSTGALLTTAFANNTVWNFLGTGKHFTSVSSINLDIIQPLLRGGGKAVTLEPLTQAERNLVYDIRAFYRYREQFFLNVVLGASVPTSLAVAAGTTSGGGGPISVLAALGLASTDVAGGFVGYLSVLYRELDMATDRKLVQELERALKIYEGYQEGGLFSPLQVDQVKSQLLGARNTVLSDEQFVANGLDQFKLVLGLPVNMPLILDDTPGRPITAQYDRYYAVIADADAAFKELEKQDNLAPEKLRAFLRDIYTNSDLVRGTEFAKRIGPAWDTWEKLTEAELGKRLQSVGEERRKLLDAKTELEMKGATLSPADTNALRDTEFHSDIGNLEQILRRYEARPWEKLPKAQQTQDRLKLFRLVAYSAELVGVGARNERFAHVGTLWPQLPSAPLHDCDTELDLLTTPATEAQEAAVKAAQASRVDLMNARAQVVDAWRQLRVTANALMGFFNVQYHLDSLTPPTGSNPLAFATSRTNSQLTLTGTLPLVRINERNAYRTALINYQRARRNLINLEDNIAAQVRFDVRQLHLFAANYTIQQKLIQSLYSQVENALELIVAPADPDNLKATGTAGAANAAALTNQYLNALSSLNGAQAKMYDIWLSFLATRMQLYLDLERLTLDSRGVWTDESGKTSGQPLADCERRPPQPGVVPLGGFGVPDTDGAGDEQRAVPAGPALPRPRFLAPTASAPLE
jgi:hypothetical protein